VDKHKSSPARGYRRFSNLPALSKNLLWKLNIIIPLIWPLRQRLSMCPPRRATFRRESASYRANRGKLLQCRH